MSTTILDLPQSVQDLRHRFAIEDDFTGGLLDAVKWTDTSPDSGATVAGSDAAGGAAVLTTGATDNNEAYLLSKQEVFLFAANKPLKVACRLKFTEANTDDANVAFGLANAVGANTIVDDGAGLKTNFSGVAIFKVDGGTRWKVMSSLATTQEIVDLTASLSYDKLAKTAGGGVYQILEIDWQPISGTVGEARFFIDGVHVYTLSFTFTSATEMNLFVGVKAGGANSEVVTVDYLYGVQQR